MASENRIQGLVTLKTVRDVPRELWASKTVSEVMTPIEKLKQVAPDTDLASVMNILTQEDINQLPVVKDGNIVGIITRENLLNFINVRDKLGV